VVLDAAAERPMPANPEFEANSPPGRLAKLSHAIEAERERRRGLSRKLIDRYLAGASQRDIEEELSVSNYTVRKISWDFICAPDIQRLATPLQTGPRITLEDVGDCSALGHARMRAVQVVLERTSR